MEIYPAMELVVSSSDKNMQVSFFSNLAILDWEIRKEWTWKFNHLNTLKIIKACVRRRLIILSTYIILGQKREPAKHSAEPQLLCVRGPRLGAPPLRGCCLLSLQSLLQAGHNKKLSVPDGQALLSVGADHQESVSRLSLWKVSPGRDEARDGGRDPSQEKPQRPQEKDEKADAWAVTGWGKCAPGPVSYQQLHLGRRGPDHQSLLHIQSPDPDLRAGHNH